MTLCLRCRRETDTSETNGGTPDGEPPHANKEGWFSPKNPYHVAMAGGAAVTVLCAAPVLAGFGTGGIVAGSLAALWQSSIGSVAAGSSFAALQSLGATGTLLTGAYGGAGIVGTGAVGNYLMGKKSKSDNGDEDAGEGDDKDKKEKDDGNGNESNTGGKPQFCASCGALLTNEDLDDQPTQ
jgi:hypothetical protein